MTDSGNYWDNQPGSQVVAESDARLAAVMARAGNPNPVSGTKLREPVAVGDYGDCGPNEDWGQRPWVPGR
jgi:hypothetical protein